MQTGVYRYHGIEHRGTNDYGRPISVVTLEREGVKNMFYAPSSLYWDLRNRSETNFIKYEGNQKSAKAMNILCLSFPNKATLKTGGDFTKQPKRFFWPIEIKTE